MTTKHSKGCLYAGLMTKKQKLWLYDTKSKFSQSQVIMEAIQMTVSPTTPDAQAFDKTQIANETQSLRHTDETLDLNELEQVFCWYHHLHRRLIASPSKDEAPNRMSRI